MLTFIGRRIFLVAGATDMRKSFNGLGGIVRERLNATPASRDLYLFCNRGRNRLKVLVFDASGTWILAKRLDKGTFAWPSTAAANETIEYGEEQLTLLLGGFDAPTLHARGWSRRTERSPTSPPPLSSIRNHSAHA